MWSLICYQINVWIWCWWAGQRWLAWSVFPKGESSRPVTVSIPCYQMEYRIQPSLHQVSNTCALGWGVDSDPLRAPDPLRWPRLGSTPFRHLLLSTSNLIVLPGHWIIAVLSLNPIQLFVTPWTAAHQVPPSFQSLLKSVSTESMRPSNHLILCHPLLLLPSIFPSIRGFSPMSWLFISGGQSIGASTLASVLPMNI